MFDLKIKENTVFKLRPKQSTELSNSEKISIGKGQIIQVEEVVPVKNADSSPEKHIRVSLKNSLKFGGKDYGFAFVYSGHIEVISKSSESEPEQKEVRLKVPYKSQLDNVYNPTGSCNVTSVAMCLEYYGVKAHSGQLEDQLYQEMLDLGLSRHSPTHLAEMVVKYGVKDRFEEYCTVEDVQAHLRSGNPAITHGYFTNSGHIIVLVGYDQDGFIVHDPYGEWFADGYRNDLSGAYLHYSYDLIRRVCVPDGNFWVHFITK